MPKHDYVSVQRLRNLRGDLQKVLAQVDKLLGSPDLSMAMAFNDSEVEAVDAAKVDNETLPLLEIEPKTPKFRVGTKPGDFSYADLVHRFVTAERFTLREALNTILPLLEKPTDRTKDIMRQSLYRDKRFAHETGDDGRVWFWRVDNANAA